METRGKGEAGARMVKTAGAKKAMAAQTDLFAETPQSHADRAR